MTENNIDKMQGMFVGLAVCDALGMVLEFKERGTFQEITGMEAGGPFNLPLGYWTDDTSMALCLADSILAKGGYDSFDVMDRYIRWKDEGYRSSTGECFDIGNQVSLALSSYERAPHVVASTQRSSSAGNGCIMRLAPIAIAAMAAGKSLNETIKIAAVSARETHYSVLAEVATMVFANMLFTAVNARDKHEIIELNNIRSSELGQILTLLQEASSKQPEVLKPTGFILDTLEVATWAFMTTDNFKDGALKAVNMGGDSDTIGAVYGQLAGAYYGFSAIPDEWLEQLHELDEIKTIANQLAQIKQFSILQTRFDEDNLNN